MKKFLKILLKFIGYEIRKRNNVVKVDFYSLYTGLAAASDKKILTVQVGANDGKTNDPIFNGAKKYSNKIILIEPQTELHVALKQNYDDFPGILEVHEAVVSEDDNQKLFLINEKFRGEYQRSANSNPTGVASLDRAHLVKMLNKHGFSGKVLDEMISEIEVRSISLEALLKAEEDRFLIVLQVDCEGADWNVINTLGTVRPQVINFEKKTFE